MTAQRHQNSEEFVWFVSRWLVVAMLGPEDRPRLGSSADDIADEGALAPRRTGLTDTNYTKEVA